MKQQLTKHWCINPKCKWEIKTHKLLEGLKCPKCNCPTQLKILKMKPPINFDSKFLSGIG